MVAPSKMAPLSCAPVKFALVKFVPVKSAFTRKDEERLTPVRLRPRTIRLGQIVRCFSAQPSTLEGAVDVGFGGGAGGAGGFSEVGPVHSAEMVEKGFDEIPFGPGETLKLGKPPLTLPVSA